MSLQWSGHSVLNETNALFAPTKQTKLAWSECEQHEPPPYESFEKTTVAPGFETHTWKTTIVIAGVVVSCALMIVTTIISTAYASRNGDGLGPKMESTQTVEWREPPWVPPSPLPQLTLPLPPAPNSSMT